MVINKLPTLKPVTTMAKYTKNFAQGFETHEFETCKEDRHSKKLKGVDKEKRKKTHMPKGQVPAGMPVYAWRELTRMAKAADADPSLVLYKQVVFGVKKDWLKRQLATAIATPDPLPCNADRRQLTFFHALLLREGIEPDPGPRTGLSVKQRKAAAKRDEADKQKFTKPVQAGINLGLLAPGSEDLRRHRLNIVRPAQKAAGTLGSGSQSTTAVHTADAAKLPVKHESPVAAEAKVRSDAEKPSAPPLDPAGICGSNQCVAPAHLDVDAGTSASHSGADHMTEKGVHVVAVKGPNLPCDTGIACQCDVGPGTGHVGTQTGIERAQYDSPVGGLDHGTSTSDLRVDGGSQTVAADMAKPALRPVNDGVPIKPGWLLDWPVVHRISVASSVVRTELDGKHVDLRPLTGKQMDPDTNFTVVTAVRVRSFNVARSALWTALACVTVWCLVTAFVLKDPVTESVSRIVDAAANTASGIAGVEDWAERSSRTVDDLLTGAIRAHQEAELQSAAWGVVDVPESVYSEIDSARREAGLAVIAMRVQADMVRVLANRTTSRIWSLFTGAGRTIWYVLTTPYRFVTRMVSKVAGRLIMFDAALQMEIAGVELPHVTEDGMCIEAPLWSSAPSCDELWKSAIQKRVVHLAVGDVLKPVYNRTGSVLNMTQSVTRVVKQVCVWLFPAAVWLKGASTVAWDALVLLPAAVWTSPWIASCTVVSVYILVLYATSSNKRALHCPSLMSAVLTELSHQKLEMQLINAGNVIRRAMILPLDSEAYVSILYGLPITLPIVHAQYERQGFHGGTVLPVPLSFSRTRDAVQARAGTVVAPWITI